MPRVTLRTDNGERSETVSGHTRLLAVFDLQEVNGMPEQQGVRQERRSIINERNDRRKEAWIQREWPATVPALKWAGSTGGWG